MSSCRRSSDQDQPAAVRMSPPAWLLGGSAPFKVKPGLLFSLLSALPFLSHRNSTLSSHWLVLDWVWSGKDPTLGGFGSLFELLKSSELASVAALRLLISSFFVLESFLCWWFFGSDNCLCLRKIPSSRAKSVSCKNKPNCWSLLRFWRGERCFFFFLVQFMDSSELLYYYSQQELLRDFVCFILCR